jgi:hypothetical protein
MNRQRIIAVVLLLMLVISFIPSGAVQAAGTDEIKNYTIDILPQDDGSLVNTYTVNWCVISNAAGPLTWITIAMPNEQYQIVSYSGDVTSAEPDNSGFDYKVRIDLSREVNAGECVNVTVQVHQYGLAYLDKNTNEIGFQFIPGWFSDVPVDHLQLTWHLPTDTTQLKSFDPKPTTQNETQATWESALQPGDKFTLNVSYDQAAFPNFNPNQQISTNAGTPGSGQTTGSTTTDNTGAPVSPVLGFILPFALTPCVCVIIIIVLIVLVVLFSALGSAGRSYRGGGFFGGYHGGGGWLGGSGGGSVLGGGGGLSIPSRSGGGSGLFGGRGSSCACVASGCACACAGGGRAGCSRKGFDVSSLFKDRQEKEIQ